MAGALGVDTSWSKPSTMAEQSAQGGQGLQHLRSTPKAGVSLPPSAAGTIIRPIRC